MARLQFLKSTGLAALAAVLSIAAVPAEARNHGDGGFRQSSGQAQQSAPQVQRSAPQMQRSAPQARPQRDTPRMERSERHSASQATQRQWNGNANGVRSPDRPNRVERQADARPDGTQRNRQWDRDSHRDRVSDRDRDNRRWDNDRRGDNRSWSRDRDRDHRSWSNNRYRDNRYRNHDRWNHEWRGDHRYDWRGYRNSHRSHYRARPYYAPYRDYYYSRIGIGFYMDSLFYSSSYWIGDPGYYRLPPAYGPYRWVRYYDDVMLVDIYTGEVVDVIYDFFW